MEKGNAINMEMHWESPSSAQLGAQIQGKHENAARHGRLFCLELASTTKESPASGLGNVVV